MDQQQLQQLCDKQAIQDLVLRYCRAIDRRDYDTLAALYHEDGFDDHGEMFRGSAGEFLAWLPGMLATMQVTSHQVMNHLIELDGDYAEGEVYVIAYHITRNKSGEDVEMVLGGRYLDQYLRREGEWKFSHRKIVADWTQLQSPSKVLDPTKTGSTPLGGVMQQDPSWAFFRLIGKS